MSATIRLMLTDDHELVRSALKQFLALSANLEIVAEASDGSELLEKLRSVKLDVLLLDLAMPGICNAELIARVRNSHPNLKILVLSMHDDTRTVLRAMKAGASGFISKNCSPTALIHAIGKVASTGKYLEPTMAEHLAFASTSPDIGNTEPKLSDREQQILSLIIRGNCIKEIANELCISDKTVSTHKAHILSKLNIKNIADLVRYSIQKKLDL